MEKNCKNCGNGPRLSRACETKACAKSIGFPNWKPKPKKKMVSAAVTMDQYEELMESANAKGVFLAEEIRDRLFNDKLFQESFEASLRGEIIDLQEEVRKKQLTIQTQREKIEELEKEFEKAKTLAIEKHKTVVERDMKIDTLREIICVLVAKQEGVL